MEKIKLKPLFKLLKDEVDLKDLSEHLRNIYYSYTELVFKVSKFDSESIDEDELTSRYWIERLIRLFEAMRSKK